MAATPEADDPRIGQTLGRYRIEKRLGRGGMGVVYQGHQLSLNRRVAIKVLPPQLAADAEFRERFRREAHAVAALNHENIVHVYDIEEADGAYFLVMELVPGQTLRKLREARRLPPTEVRSIGVALTRALGCAHDQGIVHRDVKSQNVMVTPDGAVKLMDFGIAWMADGGVKTATGHVLGTPESMAPEQALTGTSTAQSDLYSLGVLLFELATGRLPFSGSEPFSIAYKHIHEAVPLPRSLDPAIPVDLERVILRALEKDPARRYATAAEMRGELEAADLGASTVAAPAMAPAAAAASAPTVITPTAITQGTYATLRMPQRPGPWLALAGGLVLASGIGWWLLRPAPTVPATTTKLAAAPTPSSVPTPLEAARTEVVTETRPQKPAPEPRTVTPPPPATSSAPEPPAELPVSATYRCREDVDFDVSPEDAEVVVDGRSIGPADDWDGSGGAPTWHPREPVSRACFRLAGHHGACVRIVIDPTAREKTCSVDTELEEIDD